MHWYVYDLVQDCSISSVLAVEILLCCTEPSMYCVLHIFPWMMMMMPWHGSAFCISVSLWGNSLVINGLFWKGPVIWSFDVYFITNRNKLLSKQSSCWWFEMLWCSHGIILMMLVLLMGQCKTAVSPLLTHWRYCSFALSHRYVYVADVLEIPPSWELVLMWTMTRGQLLPRGMAMSWWGFCQGELLSYSHEHVGAQTKWKPFHRQHSGLIVGLRPANERLHYFVTTSLIGWVQAYGKSAMTFIN